MRVISWNVRGAKDNSKLWEIFCNLNPDVALLQEVVSIPKKIADSYEIKFKKAITKNDTEQRFGTAVLVKGKIIDNLELSSEHEWVNKELERFSGNLVVCTVVPNMGPALNVISVYSPAWPIDPIRLKGIDVSSIRLKQNPEMWVTEILWDALRKKDLNSGNEWIIGGDFNSSETFDLTFSSGNVEIHERMNDLGLTECLKAHKGGLVPTFRNPRDGKVLHQIDHLYISNKIFSKLETCIVGDKFNIFEKSLSDHLPIIADFK